MSERRVFLGVALTSLCVLMLQLALTRLFSATMHYHFAFLAISLALFGSGSAGILIYAIGERLAPSALPRWLVLSSSLFALTMLLALIVVLATPVSAEDAGLRTFARLAWIYLACGLPFLFAGCAITLAITRFARQMSRLYLYDLTGAALGCLLLIPLLNALGAPSAVLVLAALAALAGALYGSAVSGPAWLRRGPALLALLLAALAFENTHSRRLDVRRAKGLAEDAVLFSKWNSFSRVTVRGRLSDPRLLIQIDADAAATVERDGDRLERHQELRGRVEGLVYHLKLQARALIVGPGGGSDVILARVLGARQVTAVEVNPIIARDVMSSEPFRSYSGALYEQPGVRLVVDEARSFLRRSAQRYDVIQATMVDTWAATAAGAFALTENNLYTVEAFEDYLRRLAPDGLLSMTRWHQEPPDQLLRLVSLARAALAERGRGVVERRVAIVKGPPQRRFQRAPATFLLKSSPFSDAEVLRLEQVARQYGFELLYTPLTRPANVFSQLLQTDRPEAFWVSHASDVSPTRDNDPFFFHSLRLRNLGAALRGWSEWHKTNLGTFVLFGLLALTVATTLLFLLGPLLLLRGRLREVATRIKLAWLFYFASLGAGFILVEVILIQKCILFLGHPVYALSVVLFALLVFSGLGSALSGRLAEQDLARQLPRLLAAVAGLILLCVAGLSPAFYALVHLEQPYRIALCVAFLAPIGLALGMPMPTAVRLLAARAPALIPWAWGVNGAASVLGSVGALALALAWGFDQALLVAAGLYLVALALAQQALSDRSA